MKSAATKKPAKAPPRGMTFERALGALRREAKALRRRAWHVHSKIIRVDKDVFVVNKTCFGRAPKKWEPYPEDFLASDWELLS